jgi:hypothetical protein
VKKVFVMYRLRDGVTIDQYAEWSRTVDQQTTPRQPAVVRFEPYRIEGAEHGEPPFAIVEDIEVESWEQWMKTVENEAMERVVSDWTKLADEASAVHIYGSRIV